MVSKHRVFFVLLVAISLLAPAAGHAAKPSNKWRIEISEGANADGELVFVVSSMGSADIRVVATVEDGYSENHVARRVRDAMRDALPDDAFHVEVDDGEDVLVKAAGDTQPFLIRFEGSTTRGTRVNLDRE
jgi:hypothetical protein